ncbi:Chaperone protein HtpG [Candidatus Fokinia solitaria]|uniref:Chaperone protein HtpG n=1 Tax=Candidatus Fokinia solitaria TaxID=1802984 RepID=A0A2U8BRD1_9RICK|nr:molecular chaperone HtpG [Candidatus Fokinia solitaria]AWD32888.1 Chaperone protein HtpG [Candidatus Fokinia solitaria]
MSTIKKSKFGAEATKLLHMMIHSVYTKQGDYVAIRELISNASDACDKLRYTLQSGEQSTDIDSVKEEYEITVKFDEKDGIVEISDNGIGMTAEEMEQNLGIVARSGTQKFIQEHSKEIANGQIGQFGVGFYASFMIADEVTVISTKFGSNETFIWKSDGVEEFTIEKSDETKKHGTVVRLKLKSEAAAALNEYKFTDIIRTYSEHIPFKIYYVSADQKTPVNSGIALWLRDKKTISEEEYNEFYKKLSYLPDAPMSTIHWTAEGGVEYKALIFVPSIKPFNLFDHERKAKGVKLYVKRVFIGDRELSIIPPYLRFLCGIIDTESLPLNINRESIQLNDECTKISRAVVKKSLEEISKMMMEEEKGQKFWNLFGEIIKEGLCEQYMLESERNAILAISRFYTTKSPHTLISLDEYIRNMKEDQKEIFYITGKNLEELMQNPQLESFKKKDIEVLLLTNAVDDFWTTVVSSYQEKNFQSVLNADISLDNKQDDTTKEHLEAKVDVQKLADHMKEVLKERVKDVVISQKLEESPVCLSIPKGGMNSKVEKLLIEQGQLSKRSTKVLEINQSHPLIDEMVIRLKRNENVEKLNDMIEALFTCACLMQDEPIQTPHKFTKFLYETMLDNMFK